MFNIVALSGSPVKNSNTHLYLMEALGPHLERTDVNFTILEAGRMDIADCTHCNHCLLKQTPESICSINDDMNRIYEAVVPADALILATPVYLGRLSGHMAKVIDRLRALHHGKAFRGRMRNKVGAALSVAWYRHGGLETTLLTVYLAFLTMEMIVASSGAFGGAGVTSLGGDGSFDPRDRHQIMKDEFGLAQAGKTIDRVFELVDIVKKGN